MGCINSTTTKLKNCDIHNTHFLNYGNTPAKVLSVYDGDTITVAIPFQKTILKEKCRLAGINAPEIRGVSKQEKERALKSKARLEELTLNKIIWLKCEEHREKYGRVLVTIFLTNKGLKTDDSKQCVNDILLHEGLAKVYKC